MEIYLGGTLWDSTYNKLEYAWLASDGVSVYVIVDYQWTDGTFYNYEVHLYKIPTKEGLDNSISITDTTATITETKTVKSSSTQLQNTISSWYKTLRKVAIVGLLSVLVYIGIRM